MTTNISYPNMDLDPNLLNPENEQTPQDSVCPFDIPAVRTLNGFETGHLHGELLSNPYWGLRQVLFTTFLKDKVVSNQTLVTFFADSYPTIPKTNQVEIGLILNRFNMMKDFSGLRQTAAHMSITLIDRKNPHLTASEFLATINSGKPSKSISATATLWYFIDKWAAKKEQTAA